ncbi:MAG: signal peptidase I [Bacillaceae bacterium]
MRENKGKKRLQWLKTILLGVFLATLFRMFFFSTYIVNGESMLPTLREGNLLVVNKIKYVIGDIERFDVIVFHANEKEDYVKRVIGLPGDEITYKEDVLYVNNKPVKEPYLNKSIEKQKEKPYTKNFTLEELTGEKRVPEGYLFVEGDNRVKSWDSRHFGFIPIDHVVGKVNLRYWPINQFTTNF